MKGHPDAARVAEQPHLCLHSCKGQSGGTRSGYVIQAGREGVSPDTVRVTEQPCLCLRGKGVHSGGGTA